MAEKNETPTRLEIGYGLFIDVGGAAPGATRRLRSAWMQSGPVSEVIDVNGRTDIAEPESTWRSA
ncbi:MAG: hypothetical protein ACR2NX_01820 [Chthoniobacterales bacterium]